VEECLVESADDSALTYVAERPEGNARLVFPRDGVRDVWAIEAARNLHIGRRIVVGMGLALVAACGVGVFGLAVGGAIVVGIKIFYFENFEWKWPSTRRRLVYATP
jgi:hypothetical protein